MSDTINTTYGSCIELAWTFRDEAGQPDDLSGDTFEVRDAVPASLVDDFEITIINSSSGEIEVKLDADGAAKLQRGRVNRFRLCRVKSDGCEDNANILWIHVQ